MRHPKLDSRIRTILNKCFTRHADNMIEVTSPLGNTRYVSRDEAESAGTFIRNSLSALSEGPHHLATIVQTLGWPYENVLTLLTVGNALDYVNFSSPPHPDVIDYPNVCIDLESIQTDQALAKKASRSKRYYQSKYGGGK